MEIIRSRSSLFVDFLTVSSRVCRLCWAVFTIHWNFLAGDIRKPVWVTIKSWKSWTSKHLERQVSEPWTRERFFRLAGLWFPDEFLRAIDREVFHYWQAIGRSHSLRVMSDNTRPPSLNPCLHLSFNCWLFNKRKRSRKSVARAKAKQAQWEGFCECFEAKFSSVCRLSLQLHSMIVEIPISSSEIAERQPQKKRVAREQQKC